MNGYRECKSCGRRFYAADGGEYCSPACFSLASTKDERKPSRLWFVVPTACLVILLLFAIGGANLAYFVMLHVSPLSSCAASFFDEAGVDGIEFLAGKLGLLEDEDDIVAVMDGLARCRYLREYDGREQLIQEISDIYPSLSTKARASALRCMASARLVPEDLDLRDELAEPALRDAALAAAGASGNARFVDILASTLETCGDEDAFSGALVDTIASFRDVTFGNAVVLAKLVSDDGRSIRLRTRALELLPGVLWPKEAFTPAKGATSNFLRAFRVIQSIASRETEGNLSTLARRVIASGRRKKKFFVRYDALELFDSTFSDG